MIEQKQWLGILLIVDQTHVDAENVRYYENRMLKLKIEIFTPEGRHEIWHGRVKVRMGPLYSRV